MVTKYRWSLPALTSLLLTSVGGFIQAPISPKPLVGTTSSILAFDDDVAVWYEDSFTNSEKRLPIVAGNWKLNPATLGEATNLLRLLSANFVNHRTMQNPDDIPEVVVFPPYPFLSTALMELEGSGIKV